MKLIFGLGNPGAGYRKNRHNYGYMVVESAARAWDAEFSLLECRAFVARSGRFREDALLVKPLTYMNASGNAAALLMTKYNIHVEDLIVVYDDIDLPLGSIRIRRGGGAGFHKGVISIIEKLRTDEFPRLRLGIQKDKYYGDLAEYVLADFDDEEMVIVERMLTKSVVALEMILTDGIECAMRTFNVRNKETHEQDLGSAQ